MLDYAVDRAYKSWRADSSGPIPPACLYEALAKDPLVHSDSAVLQSLALSAELLKRTPDDPATLAARLVLLFRAGLFAEVGPTFNNLSAADGSRAILSAYKLAIASSMRTHDTAAMRRYLGNASAKFPAETQIAAAYRVLLQVPRLRALVDTVQRVIRKDPSMIDGYLSLTSIHGSLNQSDSALHYATVALRRRIPRSDVGKSMESLIGATLRNAQLLIDPDVWRATLTVALTIDSTLSTSASKYLIALTLSEIVADKTRLALTAVTGPMVDSRTGLSRQIVTKGTEAHFRVLTCEKLVEMNAEIALAAKYLDAGGDRFAPQTVPTIRAGLQQMREKIAMTQALCPP